MNFNSFTKDITSRELKWRNEFWRSKIPTFIHPNFLTILRILGSITLFFFEPAKQWFIFIVICLFITDYFDGIIARTQNKETTFGKWADPIADKMLLIVIIYQLYLSNVLFWNKFISSLAYIEILIILIGVVLFLLKKPMTPKPNIWSRLRFTFCFLGIVLFLSNQVFLAGILLSLAVVSGFIAVINYTHRIYD